MIVSYHGAAMVKVSQGDWVAVFNPIGRASSFKATRFGADLALVSFNDPAYNGVEEVGFGERKPFVIDGPGEYEVANTFIRGFASSGPKGLLNTIYYMGIEGRRLAHLGVLADANLNSLTESELMDVDILFVSLNLGDQGLSAKTAYQVALAIKPKLIVPVHYRPDQLKQFLKEAGEEALKPVDKLLIKGKELEGRQGDLFLLAAV